VDLFSLKHGQSRDVSYLQFRVEQVASPTTFSIFLSSFNAIGVSVTAHTRLGLEAVGLGRAFAHAELRILWSSSLSLSILQETF
jgi:hypothetical protein